jgi:hypothetical protein
MHKACVRLFDSPTLVLFPHYRPGAEQGEPRGPKGRTNPHVQPAELIGGQVVEFARLRHRLPFAAKTPKT